MVLISKHSHTHVTNSYNYIHKYVTNSYMALVILQY